VHPFPGSYELVIVRNSGVENLAYLVLVRPNDCVRPFGQRDGAVRTQVHDHLPVTNEAVGMARLVVLRIEVEANLTRSYRAHADYYNPGALGIQG